MNVLSIEDDPTTARLLEAQLACAGMTCISAHLGEEGVRLAKTYNYDLILLDLNLPDMSGMDVLRTLRVGKITTPIMILSGTTEIETKVKTFSGGADDFMDKPYHRDELIARMQAVVRRSRGDDEGLIQVGNLTLDVSKRIARMRDAMVPLSGKEYQLLEVLALRKGATITRETLFARLYGGIDEPGMKIVDVFVCRTRKKLAAENDGKHYIDSVYGQGYVLRESAEAAMA